MRKAQNSLRTRFWLHVNKNGFCWVWIGRTMKDGYGVFRVGSRTDGTRKNALVHRLSWELHNGTIPAGLLVLHKCDNPPCVRPDHLFLGTHQDNATDKMKKGRFVPNFGKSNGNARLSEEDVLLIRKYRAKKMKRKFVAFLFGISEHQVYLITAKRSWGHIL